MTLKHPSLRKGVREKSWKVPTKKKIFRFLDFLHFSSFSKYLPFPHTEVFWHKVRMESTATSLSCCCQIKAKPPRERPPWRKKTSTQSTMKGKNTLFLCSTISSINFVDISACVCKVWVWSAGAGGSVQAPQCISEKQLLQRQRCYWTGESDVNL